MKCCHAVIHCVVKTVWIRIVPLLLVFFLTSLKIDIFLLLIREI